MRRRLRIARDELARLRETLAREHGIEAAAVELPRTAAETAPPTEIEPALEAELLSAERPQADQEPWVSGRRVVRVVQATVIDERVERRHPPLSERERALLDSLARACRDAELLLSVADPSGPVRAARHALSIASREAERQELDGPARLVPGPDPAVPRLAARVS